MRRINYVGSSERRIITQANVVAAGLPDPGEDLVWNKLNSFELDVPDLLAAWLISADGTFVDEDNMDFGDLLDSMYGAAGVEVLMEQLQDEEARAMAAEALLVPLASKGQPSGVASLGLDGKIPAGQIPAFPMADFLGTVASDGAMIALAGTQGDFCIRTDFDPDRTYILAGANPAILGNWVQISTPAPVVTVNGRVGAVVDLAEQVDLDAENAARLAFQATLPSTYRAKAQTIADIREWGAAGVTGPGVDNAPAVVGLWAAGIDEVRAPVQAGGVYKMGTSTIVVENMKKLKLSRGAEWTPMDTATDMFQVKENGELTGGKINASVLPNFAAACVKMLGSATFGTPRTRPGVHNIGIQDTVGLAALGTLILLDTGTVGDSHICFARFHNMQLDGGLHVIRLEARTPLTGNTALQSYINGNYFTAITSSRGRNLLTMNAPAVSQIDANVFDIIHQCNSATQEGVRAIGNVRSNKIDCLLFDWAGNKGQFAAGYVFDEFTKYNKVWSPNFASLISDKGYLNKFDVEAADSTFTMVAGSSQIVKHNSFAPNSHNQRTKMGDVDDFLAYADLRYTVTRTGPTSASGTGTAISAPFRPTVNSPALWQSPNQPTVGNPVVYEIDMGSSKGAFSALGASFWGSDAPQAAKCEIWYTGAWHTILDTTTNQGLEVVAYPHNATSGADMSSTSKIRWTFWGAAAGINTSGNLRLARLWGFNAWLPGQQFVPWMDFNSQRLAIAPTGALAETCLREGCTSLALLTSGQEFLYSTYLEAGRKYSRLNFRSGTQALVGGVNQWFTLRNSARTLLSITSDDGASAWAASSTKSLPLQSGGVDTPYVPATSGLYYIGIMVNAGTVPDLLGKTGSVLANQVTPLRTVGADTARTNTASAASPAAANSVPANIAYAWAT